ncbi:hypothetical protein WMF37_25825 [Sorangium sp. So ce291]|uniref:hypothetical protein n=1 Tax=Sorangium sp. So ce291 TaxID=3133294 RepID=UPI003F621C61
MRLDMVRRARLLAAAGSLAAGGASGLWGCAYAEECGEERSCPAPPELSCEALEPGAGPVIDRCGVFVSASAPEGSPRAGTRRAPFKTLQEAIVGAQARGLRHVYACGETFEEEVVLTSGVHLWGGRACADGTWAFAGPDQRTIIAPPAGIPLRVLAGEGATSTIVGARVVAADASASDGKSSIAVILSQGARATVRASEILPGNGKEGETGEDAPSARARDGVLGNHGADACTAELATGALPVVTACDDGTESVGGYGGDGGIDRGGDGAPGKPEPAENGDGGRAGTGTDLTTRCSSGNDGDPGADGGRAAGAAGEGRLGVDGWIGVRGEDGRRGGLGQGGGGGGGSKSRGPMVSCPTSRPQAGAAGGSGGSGGCGGQGGKGGSYGGASIGIVALQESVLTVEGSEVIAGSGGRGGVGGRGQPGGKGGVSGRGGRHRFADSAEWGACDGGNGGNGGNGGDAGGGLGGASFGIASAGATVTLALDAIVRPGSAGTGGLAGNATVGGVAGNGAPGLARFWYRFDAPDPEPPQ